MKLKLTRPIVSWDLETTGVDTQKDRIVEIAIVKLHPDGKKETRVAKVNPTIAIPKGASDVHGILDEHVKDCPTFKQLAKGILSFIEGCDSLTFNGNRFDTPLLHAEFERAGIIWDYRAHKMIDASVIFRRFERRTLEAALMFYCEKELEGAHGALADTEATLDVFIAQTERYNELPELMDELELFCNYDKDRVDLGGCFEVDEQGEFVLTFGKHKGQKAKDCISYLNWMLGSDFSSDTKLIIKQLLSKPSDSRIVATGFGDRVYKKEDL